MVFIQLLGQTHLSMFYLPSVMIFAKSRRLKRLMDDHGLRAGNYRRVLGYLRSTGRIKFSLIMGL